MSVKTAIDNYTDKLKARIESLWAGKNIIGDDGARGTIYRNIFQGFIRTLTTGESGPYMEGDFPAIGSPLGSDSNVYLHIRLPFNVNVSSRMFWLKVTGYSFGSSQQVSTTAVGYCYATTNQLLNSQVSSVQTSELYVDTNGNIVLTILFSSIYYTTIEIDSMMVGNGTPIKKGMLEVKYSTSNRVAF